MLPRAKRNRMPGDLWAIYMVQLVEEASFTLDTYMLNGNCTLQSSSPRLVCSVLNHLKVRAYADRPEQ